MSLHGETSYFEPPHSGFTYLGSILGQGKIMNVPVFFEELNLIFLVIIEHLYACSS